MITPSSIYAPGSLMPAPDGDAGYAAPPGPGAAPGYAAAPGHPAAPGHGQPNPGASGYPGQQAAPGYPGGPGGAGTDPYGASQGYPGPGHGVNPAGGAGTGYPPPNAYGGASPPGYGRAQGAPAGPAGGRASGGYQGPSGHPYEGPNAYASPGGYAEPVNGGSYAYVISGEEEFPVRPKPAAPAPEPPRPEPPRPEPPRPEPPADPDTTTFAYRDDGAPPAPGEPDPVDPEFAYGPDDPAYGPPSPDWYTRAETVEEQPAEDAEPQRVRGPFEPLPQSAAGPGMAGHELPGAAGDGFGERGGGALHLLKDLYLRAEATGPGSGDRHFEELLERQRQLISEYFKESGRGERPGPGGANRASGSNGGEDMNGFGGGPPAFGSDERSDQRSPR